LKAQLLHRSIERVGPFFENPEHFLSVPADNLNFEQPLTENGQDLAELND
jgi:hypothetical protein